MACIPPNPRRVGYKDLIHGPLYMGSHIHQQFPYPLIWLWPVSFCYMVTSISQFVIASTAIHYSSSWTPSLSEWKHIAICSFLALVCCNFRHIVMWCDVIYLLPVRSPVSTKCFPWFLVALKPKKQRWLYPSTAQAKLILHGLWLLAVHSVNI